MFANRWSPLGHAVWNRMDQLQTEMNRLFDRWGEPGRAVFGLTEFPALNLWEEADAFVLEAELPGLELTDLEIFVTNHNQLTLKGERKAPTPEGGVLHRQERGFGSFVRTLTLPVAVDENQVDARFEHGVLKVRLPKHEGAKPRKIMIKA